MISSEAALTWFERASIFKCDSWEEHRCGWMKMLPWLIQMLTFWSKVDTWTAKLRELQNGEKSFPQKSEKPISAKRGEIYLRSLWLSLLSSLRGSPPRSSLRGSSFTLASDDDRVSLLTKIGDCSSKILNVEIGPKSMPRLAKIDLFHKSPFPVPISLPGPLPLAISVLVVLTILLPAPVLPFTTPTSVPAPRTCGFKSLYCLRSYL